MNLNLANLQPAQMRPQKHCKLPDRAFWSALRRLVPAMLADWMISCDFIDGRLIDLAPDYEVTPRNPETTVWLLYPSRTYLPAKVRVMIDFLKSRLGHGNDRPARPVIHPVA